MSMFKETKEMIDATIYENGNGEITAQNVNLAMHGMLDAVETEVEAVKDKVAEIEENGVGGGGSDVANVYLPMYAELTDDELAKNRDAFEKMKNGAPVQFVLQDIVYIYCNYRYLYMYFSEDDAISFVVAYEDKYLEGTTITSLIHKQDWYTMYPDGSVVLELSNSEEPSTPASSGPLRVWKNDGAGVETTQEMISDNINTYNVLKAGNYSPVVGVISDGDGGVSVRSLEYSVVGNNIVMSYMIYNVNEEGLVQGQTSVSFSLNSDGTIGTA